MKSKTKRKQKADQIRAAAVAVVESTIASLGPPPSPPTQPPPPPPPLTAPPLINASMDQRDKYAHEQISRSMTGVVKVKQTSRQEKQQMMEVAAAKVKCKTLPVINAIVTDKKKEKSRDTVENKAANYTSNSYSIFIEYLMNKQLPTPQVRN